MSLVGFGARNHPQQSLNPSVDNRETAPEFFAPLHDRFGFTLDVASLEHNSKLPRYFDPEADGLVQSWDGERVWCNPPYSNVRPWIEKAWASECPIIVMILPANRTEQGWWQDLVEPYRDREGSILQVEFIRGRTRFIAHDDDRIRPNARPPFGCCLLIWTGTDTEGEL